MQNTDSQDSSPAYFNEYATTELHRYGKGTKNMQIVSATVRKRWVKGWRLCSNRPMVENSIEY